MANQRNDCAQVQLGEPASLLGFLTGECVRGCLYRHGWLWESHHEKAHASIGDRSHKWFVALPVQLASHLLYTLKAGRVNPAGEAGGTGWPEFPVSLY